MATSNLPTPQPLQPITDDKNLLAVLDEGGSSCCGGGSCSTN